MGLEANILVSLFLIIPYMHLQGLSIIRDLTRDVGNDISALPA